MSARVAIFVDGCFWYGCPIHSVKPKTRAKFWEEKIGRNRARDAKVNSALRALGWTVLRFWEHEVYDSMTRIVSEIRSGVKAGIV